jgi:hypothetical protein
MARKLVALLFVAMLLVSLGIFSNLVIADNTVEGKIRVEAPAEGGIYYSDTLTAVISFGAVKTDSYYIDSETYSCKLDNIYLGQAEHDYLHDGSFAYFTLNNLSPGEHVLEVSASGTAGYVVCPAPDRFTVNFDSVKVHFFINLGPEVSIAGYDVTNTKETTLTIVTNKSNATVSYSLDRQANVTLPKSDVKEVLGNYHYSIKFSNLTYGQHSFCAYAVDDEGRVGMSQKNFLYNITSIITTQPSSDSPESGTTILLEGAIAGTFIGAAVIFLFYRKVRKDRDRLKFNSA